MAKIFDDILTQGIRSGKMPARSKSARDWYRDAAKKVRNINEKNLMKDSTRKTHNMEVGSMYMYFYDPKWKNELPFYDRFPLIFPFQKTNDGFMGINLHYLPPALRARLMDALYELANDKSYDEKTKLNLSYKILKSSARLRDFKPCVKRYLNSHLRSEFLYVYPSEWDIALMLPLERFEKQSKARVWEASKRSINA